MNLLDKPIISKEIFKRMEDMSWFIHARIFDDLLIVAQKETNCFVLKTDDGLIVIDAIWPSKKAFDAIVNAVEAIGWNSNDIRKLVLTHGHADHTGCGKWFIEQYGVDTYLSKVDDIFWEKNPVKPNNPETWKDYDISFFIKDGDTITLGDKTIFVFSTPGHTPGGLSYIFPVTEDGNTHMAALWGGTTPPRSKSGVMQYLKSLDFFVKKAVDMRVDVALSNHTAVDNGIERIRYSKARMSYMPNIYIVGEDGFKTYCKVFKSLSYEILANADT
ncbi:MBL fold metallo-hydrolase [bacterium 210820-DFI.6.37]|nr:MBL fold metallo-hydrolase [bacterium 210820-DFI.6.37]